jgi:hypothetical protein
VLVGADRADRHELALLERGQAARLVIVLAFLVRAFLVHRQKAGLDHRRAGGAEGVVAARAEVDAHRVEQRRRHLAGHGALPDQLVELLLVGIEERGDRFGRVPRGGRADASCASCAFLLLVL